MISNLFVMNVLETSGVWPTSVLQETLPVLCHILRPRRIYKENELETVLKPANPDKTRALGKTETESAKLFWKRDTKFDLTGSGIS